MKLTKAQAWPIVKLVYPNYTGRKFFLEFKDKITFWDTNWSGGTKNNYRFVKKDGQTAEFNAPAPWCNPVEGMEIELPDDVLVIKEGFFCGHEMGITIIANPNFAPKWLMDSTDYSDYDQNSGSINHNK
jgi:hypothetical protein